MPRAAAFLARGGVMLAFVDDQALARVLIAGTAIASDERSAWLQNLAVHFERSERDPPSAGAIYTARWRERRRAGRILLHLELDEAELAVGLVDRGLLSPLQADDPAALTVAATKALTLYCRGEASRPDVRIIDTVRAELLAAVRRKTTRGRLPTRNRKGPRSSARGRRR